MSNTLFDMLTKEQEIGPDTPYSPVSKDYSGNFQAQLKQWKNRVINDYDRYKIDVNKAIAQIAEQNNLNNDQIQRLVEEVNTQIYLIEYNKLKDKTSREVDFDIASVQKIKDMMSNGAKANTEKPNDPETKGEKETMKKEASSGSSGEKLNFLNHTSYDMAGFVEEKRITKRQIYEEKLAEKITKELAEFNKLAHEQRSDVDCVAEALVKYAQLHQDTNEIFENVCKGAGLLKKNQLLIKEAVEKKINTLKEFKKVANNFEISLSLVDGTSPKSELSLGDYSLIKEAKEGSSNGMPQVITDKKLIKGYSSLIELATKIQERQEELDKKVPKKQQLEKMLQPK